MWINKINAGPRRRRTPSVEATPTPALARLLSPPEDVDDEDVDDGDVFAAEDVDICDVIITVEEAGEAVVVITRLVDVGTAEAEAVIRME